MSYLAIKHLHVLLAVITIAGFLLRGLWMMTNSHRLHLRTTRIAPHVIDALLFLAGVVLLVMLSLNPWAEAWLIAKFAGLFVYVLLGTIALRRGRTREIRQVAFVGAIAVFAYVVGVALSKSPASWLAWIA